MTPQEIRELRAKVWKAELRTQQLPDATSVPHTPDPANVVRSPASPASPVLANLLKSQINMALAQHGAALQAAEHSAPHTPDPANVARNPASPTSPVLANLLKSQINMALAQQDSAEEAAAEEFDDRIKIIILDVCLPVCREISC